MAGWAGEGTYVGGYYWSKTKDTYPGGPLWALSVSGGGVSVDPQRFEHAETTGYLIRCVRAREGQAVPCFFPVSGSAGGPTDLHGNYWTTTYHSTGVIWVLHVIGGTGAEITSVGVGGSFAYSVRCVRAREGQAVPLFWIVGFLGSLNYEGLAGVQGILVGASGACQACSVTHRQRYGFR